MIYLDEITKKPIEYNENDFFCIYVKGGYHKKRLMRAFSHERISEALKFFYDLEITKNHRKHFVRQSKDSLGESHGEVIYNMKGYFPNANALKLKLGRNVYSYKKIATLNLIHTPITLAKKLSLFDLDTLPPMQEAWSKSKLVYCLLSYIFSISEKDRNEIMRKAYRAYVLDKLESGGQESKDISEFKEIVASQNFIDDDDML